MSKKPKLSFYRRVLPCPPAVSFSSIEGRMVFQEALLEGGMQTYFTLAEQFRTQNEPAYCALGTLVMALNTLAIDPGRLWKGGWRWFAEEMLDCCKSLKAIKKEGLHIDEFICLALCNGAEVEKKDPGVCSLSDFRKEVSKVCSDPSCKEVLVVNYSRKEFGQTGDGHFSPIGGYNKKRDLVLIMDVARFKYPPHWAPLDLCYKSMKRIDRITKHCRGWLVLSASPDPNPLFFRWKGNLKHIKNLVRDLPRSSNFSPEKYVEEVVRYILKTPAGCSLRAMEQYVDLSREPLSMMHDQIRESCLEDIRSLPLYTIIKDQSLKQGLDASQAEATTLCVIISVPSIFPETAKLFPVDYKKMPDLAREIRALRRQLKLSCSFGESLKTCGSDSCKDQSDAKMNNALVSRSL